MEEYIVRGGKRLALGYTTGSCAAAAAKAAAWMLLSGRKKEEIELSTPKGIALKLPVHEIEMQPGFVSCATQKDGGDDPDVTHGALVYAKVERSETPGVTIDGGVGVGRVTMPGLDQPVGNAAINSVPRRMIEENVLEVMQLFDCSGGLSVVISIPAGVELAKKTFNPRFGIVGGISVLGTTGIVEPMSEKALLDTIHVELRQRRAEGHDFVLLVPGNYGADFIHDTLHLDPELAVQASNFIGDTLDFCAELGFRGALLVGHIGKVVKLGGGMLNTHSKYGDCRMEILSAMAGAEGVKPETIQQMLACVSCDEALRLLMEDGKHEAVLKRLMERVGFHLSYRTRGAMEVGCMTFSKVYGLLGKTETADDLLQKILEEA